MKKIIAVLLSFLMVFCLYGCGKEEVIPEFDWNDVEMKDQLPKPTTTFGEIHVNSDNSLMLDLNQAEKEDYRNYKNACQTFGYTIDSDDGNNSYDAFNEDGYKLHLYYYESNKEISIDLDAPEKMGEISWPENGVGSLLPIPESNIGKIEKDSSESFKAYIGEMTMESFNNYIKSCEDCGFTNNYDKRDTSYSAENSDGYKIELRYEGFYTVYISIEEPSKLDTFLKNITNDESSKPESSTEKVAEEKEPVEENEIPEPEEVEPEKVETEKSDEMVNGMRKEFKEAMDSYESYMDSYVEFMKTYDSSSATALIEYSKMLIEYANLADKFEKWNDGTLNNAELSYYIEVQSRVNQKLLSIS